MTKLPFSLTVRGDSPFYYVRFRNERTGKFMSWISTKEKNYNRALRKAWDLYNEKSAEIDQLSYYDTLRKSEYTQADVQKFLEDFQRKGFLTTVKRSASFVTFAPHPPRITDSRPSVCFHIIEICVFGTKNTLCALQNVLRTLWPKDFVVALFPLGKGCLQK